MRLRSMNKGVNVREMTFGGRLDEVAITAHHPRLPDGVVYLDPMQLTCVLAEMSTDAYPVCASYDCGCHADARHVTGVGVERDGEVLRIEAATSAHGLRTCLVPRGEERDLFKRLEKIALGYLHTDTWGGEDAGDQ